MQHLRAMLVKEVRVNAAAISFVWPCLCAWEAIRKLVKASWHWTGVCSCHPFMAAQHSMIGIAVS